MDGPARFRIVFDKLEEASQPEEPSVQLLEEAEEIAELRRIVLEVLEPAAATYTTT